MNEKGPPRTSKIQLVLQPQAPWWGTTGLIPVFQSLSWTDEPEITHSIPREVLHQRQRFWGLYEKKALKVIKREQMLENICSYSVIKFSKYKHFHFSITAFSVLTLIQEK